MKLIVDSREKLSFGFENERYKDITLQRKKLEIGDYSIEGFEDSVAIERKSLPDLVQCLGRDRTRFEKELLRARGLDSFCVVVEDSFLSLARGEYRSQLNPHSACQSILAFTARYGVPFLFAGSRTAAEYCTYSFLRQYLKGVEAVMKNVQKNIAA